MQLTSYLPQTAKISDKITVIRSMTAKVGVHASAAYLMRTGFEQRGTLQHPTLGAWAQHFSVRATRPCRPPSPSIARLTMATVGSRRPTRRCRFLIPPTG